MVSLEPLDLEGGHWGKFCSKVTSGAIIEEKVYQLFSMRNDAALYESIKVLYFSVH
jgi:hypothetical protein